MYITIRGFMMAMMTLLILFLCLFPRAHAQQVCPPTSPVAKDAALLCWTNATQDVNGAPLPATGPGALTQTRIQRAQVPAANACAFTTIAQTLNVTPDVTMVFFENMPAPFKQCFRLRHASLDAASVEMTSDWSAIAFKVTAPPIPPPAKARAPAITIH